MSPPSPAPLPAPGDPWRNFGWLVGGRVLRMALSVVVGAWVARQLGPASYGLLNSVQAVVLMVLAVAGLGLDSLVRQRLVREPEAGGAILGTCIGLRTVAGLVAYAALAAATAAGDPVQRGLWLVMGAMLVTHTPLSIDFWFQANLQLRHSAIAQNLAFALSSALRVALILSGAPLIWFAAVIVLDGPVTALYLFVVYRKHAPHQPFTWRRDLAREWLRACGPLLGAGLVAAAFARIDQALILWLANPAEAGRFAAASRVFELAAFVPVALVTTLMPALASSRAAGPAAVEFAARSALNTVAGVGWFLTLALMASAGLIVSVLFGPAYLGSETPLRLLAAALLLQGLGAVRTECWVSAGWPSRLLAATLAGAVLNLLLACWWIPRWGARGAAGAAVAALAVSHVLTSFWWRDARAFARWQLQALAGAALWRPAQPPPA